MLARMARTGARPGDWKAEPLPEKVGALAFKRSFSAAEFMRLQRGVVPEQMEDKWFVVWHDDALWMHRSWTGICVYRLRFAVDRDRVAVIETLVNRQPGQYQGTDEHDLHLVNELLDLVLFYATRRR